MKKILIAGESWMSHTTHVKGFDTFTTSVYEEGIKWLREAFVSSGYEVEFIPNHLATENFPYTMEEIKKYDVVILSDIGANTLLLPNDTFTKSQKMPNRLTLIKDYVEQGGSFCMIGGYLTFTGIDAKAKYFDTVIDDILPVQLLPYDDRVEVCEGVYPKVEKDHEIFSGIPYEWPHFLGYNKTKVKKEGKVIATINNDPFVAVREYGKGKTAAFTSDCAPHWAPPEFCEWDYYKVFWDNLMKWLCK